MTAFPHVQAAVVAAGRTHTAATEDVDVDIDSR